MSDAASGRLNSFSAKMKFQFRVIVLVLVVISGLSASNAARILVAQPMGTKSHQNPFIPLILELDKRGHQVTVITNYASSQFRAAENVEEIILSELAVENLSYLNETSIIGMVINGTKPTFSMIWKQLNMLQLAAEVMYTNPAVKSKLMDDRFDLIVISQVTGKIGYPLAWHFEAPFILISPGVMFPGLAHVLGDSDHTEHIPFAVYTDRMTLKERLINTFTNHLIDLLWNKWTQWGYKEIIHKTFPGCPSIDELEKNVSMAFTNTHHMFNYPRVLPPQVIEVGGMHCKSPKPLPTDIEEFISSSEAGFMVFAIGSALDMNEIPDAILQSFISVFSRLPQRVIWQWKGKPRLNMPPNVKTIAWIPQQDLLGHKDCRLFLTHGGLNSLQEAVYHGVPVLGLPLVNDQISNMKRAIIGGYGLVLEWKDISESSLTETLHELLNTTQYSEAAQRASLIFRDQIETPLERAVFWVEHVLQHKGAPHLRLGSRELSWYQRKLIDVYSLLFLIAALPTFAILLCLQRYCCLKKSNERLKKKKD